jgi:hypothetical protein
MSDPPDMPRIGSKRWIAWKLVQVAHRFYNAEYYERIAIKDPDGDVAIEWVVNADLYGGGVSYCYGVLGDSFGGGYTATWEEFTPDWLEIP